MAYKNEVSVNISKGGLGMFILFLVFLGLKLGGVINWSWWWITAPLWGPIALSLAICVVIIVLWIIIKMLKSVFHRNVFGK